MIDALKKIMPVEFGTIYFIGIGGIGMSGLAEILHNLGYKVAGSDIKTSYVTERLQKIGVSISFNQQEFAPAGIGVVVRSTAINNDHLQLKAALKAGIPVIDRAQMLAELMRLKYSIAISGTHGKTTTTSMVAHILEAASLEPTVINGGIINQLGTNAYLGKGDFLVAEADESDGTFIRLPIYAAIVTNINPEHLTYYKTFAKAKEAYLQFINNVPFYGFTVACFDCPNVRELASQVQGHNFMTYAINHPDVDLRAVNIRHLEKGMLFDVVISSKFVEYNKFPQNVLKDVKLGIHGRHNVLNALAAIVVAIKLNIQPAVICASLADFAGVKRRFTKVTEIEGVSIIDDYAHHPVEIKATLSTARALADRQSCKVVAIMQPHRYSRFNDLFEQFATAFGDADHIFIAPIYAAGEVQEGEATVEKLVEMLKAQGKKADILTTLDDAHIVIKQNTQSGDMVLFLGAGDITNYAYALRAGDGL